MEPGRELDALVAEKAMGYRRVDLTPEWLGREVWCFYPGDSPLMEYSWDEPSGNAMMHRNGKDESDGTADILPSYSTDIAAAFEIVEKLRDQHMELELSVVPKGAPAYPDDAQWLAGFSDDGPTNQEWGATAPHAICLAALKAVE